MAEGSGASKGLQQGAGDGIKEVNVKAGVGAGGPEAC